MGRAMPTYRFYAIEKTGRVAPPKTYICGTDGGALKVAKLVLNDRDIEVWQDTHLVAYVVPEVDHGDHHYG
jgi:hypothetical protein